MCEIELWTRIFEQALQEYEFDEGYKVVFGPWYTLRGLDMAFFTDFPGLNTPEAFDEFSLAEENENTYVREFEEVRPRIGRRLPINKQFKKFSEFVHRKPLEIMTGVATPFRTESWNNLDPDKQIITKFYGKTFWTGPVLQSSIKTIVTSGNISTDMILDITNAHEEDQMPSGWANVSLRRYLSQCGKTIIQLPYLGTYKLFSRPECETPLHNIFKLTTRRL